MFQKTKLSSSLQRATSTTLSRTAAAVAGVLFSVSVAAQQSGSIEGTVYLDDKVEAAGVTVTATSPVMPKSRTVQTDADGDFRLPALIPGTYTLTFTTEDGITRKVQARVLLDQRSNISVVMMDGDAGQLEEVAVLGEKIEMVGGGASLSNAFGADVIDALPVGQSYRDVMKLLPGVQLTADATRGPNAGGSGQDNTYAFDGVNVTLPMFGTLSAEPSSQDIEQVSVDRGGARAVGFNRAGGVSVDTKSKSGTNEYKSSFNYRIQPSSLSEPEEDGIQEDTEYSWLTANVSGPLIEDTLFFYGSYYGPRETRDNKETAYGPTKDYRSERDEYFGKLTYAVTEDILLNASYRTSDRLGKGVSISEFEDDSVSNGESATQDIITFDGSWIISDATTFTFQYSDFAQESGGRPDTLLAVQPEYEGALDIANLDQMGYFDVPNLDLGNADYDNVVAQQLIDQYGYISDGQRVGGGAVGGYRDISTQGFYRKGFEMALEHRFEIGATSHELHLGYQWSEGKEDLWRRSNGWGQIEYVGGEEFTEGGEAVYFRSKTEQMSFVNESGSAVSSIVSYTEANNFEINDVITWNDLTFNVGILVSEDTYYGQGLKENSANYSGFELAPGHKYEMHNIDWKDMIQPRLGVTWAYNGEDTVFANFAQYNPQASSLARAASWDRNTQKQLEVAWDADGNYLGYEPASGSSGKMFQEGLQPRRVDELTIGTTKGWGERLATRAHVRYREGSHFWEDTWNWARSDEGCYGDFDGDGVNEHCVPADIEALGPYLPDLNNYRYGADGVAGTGDGEIYGSSYVIAEMDGAYTEYWELALEAEWYGDNSYLNASYVYSQYTGNIDQDNTSGANDDNLFIGSSNYADDYGQYTWDLKDGTLRGDKPHLLKVFGYYTLDWKANVGAFFTFQSGQPWEAWDGSIYGRSSDTIRYAERAGSRRSPSHWQMDLNYTQDFKLFGDYTMKFRADIFNVFDRQTGYNMTPYVSSEEFGEARSYYDPRRIQLSFGFDL
ncbi:carboxypeptidase regulatory-like domain-containing protein [Microbulbifer bruguierae]|uniref:Carboxypeptidase regulatory-like domain-containing protein n=1 Tax=Microbulbifer bruguierae TaxID=3029061 RepID=A0ABY8NCH9_9GAMM|nr:carboxypeptidase regulatory-like domain-containing protein [Microbulbifer bruguierae]WGL16302.1 carboxypeptidase regulatory-like domain-containing protein [Microbulbifer bruguierae]